MAVRTLSARSPLFLRPLGAMTGHLTRECHSKLRDNAQGPAAQKKTTTSWQLIATRGKATAFSDCPKLANTRAMTEWGQAKLPNAHGWPQQAGYTAAQPRARMQHKKHSLHSMGSCAPNAPTRIQHLLCVWKNTAGSNSPASPTTRKVHQPQHNMQPTIDINPNWQTHAS